jgi:nickel/cobalt exporter
VGRAIIVVAAATVPLAVAGPASAHPLGNFTVNAAVALTVSPGEVRVDYVLDLAEIPTFQELGVVDADGDGTAEDPERSAWAARRAEAIGAALSLTVDGDPVPLRVDDAAMTLGSGQGGLAVLRLEVSLLGTVLTGDGVVAFRDVNDPGRVGWREVTAAGAGGLAVGRSSVPMVSPSDALRAYPQDLLSSPPSVRRARFTFAPGSQVSATGTADPVGGRPRPSDGPLAELVARSDLSPSVVLLALAAAVAVGALHALAPGHGKAVAAAYLAGTGSRMRQALTIGGAVAVMHTTSVLVLGGVLLFARGAFPAERLYPWLGIAAGGAAIVLGAGLLVHRPARPPKPEDGHGHDHPPLSRRGLTALALSGGLLPSPTAVVVLLAAASLDRLPLGLGMVAAFGVGLAASLTAVGVLAIGARTALRWRIPARLTEAAPMAGAGVIVAMGVVLALRAVTQL